MKYLIEAGQTNSRFAGKFEEWFNPFKNRLVSRSSRLRIQVGLDETACFLPERSNLLFGIRSEWNFQNSKFMHFWIERKGEDIFASFGVNQQGSELFRILQKKQIDFNTPFFIDLSIDNQKQVGLINLSQNGKVSERIQSFTFNNTKYFQYPVLSSPAQNRINFDFDFILG